MSLVAKHLDCVVMSLVGFFWLFGFFSFSFFLGIKIVCKMGVVSKPYIFVCVLIDSDIFFCFVLLFPYDFVLNPKMPVSLLVPHFHLFARLSSMCCCLEMHMESNSCGLGVGVPTSLWCSLNSRVSLT